jgi:hypothetical protein
MKKIVFIFICFFLFPLVSNAECTVEVENIYKKMADNLDITYQVKSKDKYGNPVFEIDIANLARGLMVMDMQTGKRYQSYKDGYNLAITNIVKPGNYEIVVYTDRTTTGCGVITLRTLNISIPKYNKYYNRKECNGLTSYSVCQRWSGFDGTETEFQNAIKKATADKNYNPNEEEESKKKTNNIWFNNLTLILINYWWLILIILVIIFTIYFILRIRYRRKYYSFKL